MSLAEHPTDINIETLDACPVCGGRRLKNLPLPSVSIGRSVFGEHQDRLGLCRCSDCSLIFTNPRPTPFLLEQFYDGCSREYSCHHPVEIAAAETSQSNSSKRSPLRWMNLSADAKMLDYGTGSGEFVRTAIDAGWKNSFGFDISETAVEGCRQRGIRAFSDFDEACEHGPFDAITMNSVLEHVPNLTDTLASIRSALQPDGNLFILVPNAPSFRARISSDFVCRHMPDEQRYRAYPIHLNYFSSSSLKRLLERTGFKIKVAATEGAGLQPYSKWIKGRLRGPVSKKVAPAAASPPIKQTTQTKSPQTARRESMFRRGVTRALSRLNLGEKLIFVASPHGT